MRGEPLPLTKNISPPPNFRLEVEKKLGGIMNSRNSDNKEATWLTECAESAEGQGHLHARWTPDCLHIFAFSVNAEVLVLPKTRVSLLP